MTDIPTAAARRFQLATRVEALARGAETLAEHAPTATDDILVQALEKLEAEVAAVRALAEIVRDLAEHEEASDV